MELTKFVIFFGLSVVLFGGFAHGFPQHRNPNAEFELISGGAQVVPTAGGTPKPVSPRPHVINTPPPVDPNSKTFAYNANSKTWSVVKKNDPLPAEDTLLWNQSNDKWLTQTARV